MLIFAIIAAVLLAVLLIFVIVLVVRAHRFHPTPDKLAQQSQLNSDLESAGFAYDLKDDLFYSRMDCWQREVGYCKLYDEGAALFNMIMDCEPVTFSYAGKRWLIELWKGQYGITTGAEIGIYNTTREDINSEKFKGTFYETISNQEMLPMSFVLRKNGKVLFRRKAVHWWITGFKLGEFSSVDSLTMDAKIIFPNQEMRNAFVNGLRQIGYQRKEFSVRRRTVTIHYTKPHCEQPISRNKVQETLVQQTNENNCKLYRLATNRYSDTLDKLEYAKALAPELYELFVHSLYAKGLYEAFDWIREIIFGHHPKPEPVPPTPCPPKPYPPEPPCPPRPCPPEPPCPPKPCMPDPCSLSKPCCQPEPCPPSNSCCQSDPCSLSKSCCQSDPCSPSNSCCQPEPCPPSNSYCPPKSCSTQSSCGFSRSSCCTPTESSCHSSCNLCTSKWPVDVSKDGLNKENYETPPKEYQYNTIENETFQQEEYSYSEYENTEYDRNSEQTNIKETNTRQDNIQSSNDYNTYYRHE